MLTINNLFVNDSCLVTLVKIIDVHNLEEKTDKVSLRRKGCTFKANGTLLWNNCLWLDYVYTPERALIFPDKQLKISEVTKMEMTSEYLIVTTLNNIYYFEPFDCSQSITIGVDCTYFEKNFAFDVGV